MKVKDLINELIRLPQDSEILFSSHDWVIYEIDSIKPVQVGKSMHHSGCYTKLEDWEVEDYKEDPDNVLIDGPPIQAYCID